MRPPLVALLLALMPFGALAQNCDAILKSGVFDELTSSTYLKTDSVTIRAACNSMDRNFAGTAYTEYGIFDSNYKEARKACENVYNSQSLTDSQYLAIKTASKPIVDAWKSCLSINRNFRLALKQDKDDGQYDVVIRNLGVTNTITLRATNTTNCSCPARTEGVVCNDVAAPALKRVTLNPGTTGNVLCNKASAADEVGVTAIPSVSGDPQQADLPASRGELTRQTPNATALTGACFGNRSGVPKQSVSLLFGGALTPPVYAILYWQDLAHSENAIELGSGPIDLWKQCAATAKSCTVEIPIFGTLSANITGKTTGLEASGLFIRLAKNRADNVRAVTILSGQGGCGSGGGYGVDIPALQVTTFRQ